MNRHEFVAIPALVFVVEAEDVTEFVSGHPVRLPPPECRDVDLHASALAEAVAAGVVSSIGLAGEMK